jgi:HSP20 family molecular chaperone IbpA
MNEQSKMRLLGATLAVCVLVIAVLSYNTWDLSKEVSALKAAPPSPATRLAPQTIAPWPDNFDPWSGNWDPGGHFEAARKRMEAMMSNMLPGKSIFSHQGFGLSPAYPRVSMSDTEDEYRITVDVHDGQEVELNTTFENNVLTISGIVKSSSEDNDNNRYSVSHSSARFSQTMTLPDPVDESAMTIDKDDEEIVVVLPKLKDK